METSKKSRSPKKVAGKVAKAVTKDTVATVGKVTRVLSHAKESIKLLETLSAEKTRATLLSGVRKLGTAAFTPELAQAEEISTLRTEFHALRDRIEEIELQLASILGQSRRDRSFVKATASEPPLPRS